MVRHLEEASAAWNQLCRWRLPMTEAAYEVKEKGRDWILDAGEAMRVDASDRVLP